MSSNFLISKFLVAKYSIIASFGYKNVDLHCKICNVKNFYFYPIYVSFLLSMHEDQYRRVSVCISSDNSTVARTPLYRVSYSSKSLFFGNFLLLKGACTLEISFHPSFNSVQHSIFHASFCASQTREIS